MVKLLCALTLSLILVGTAAAVDGVDCRLALYQHDSDKDTDVLLFDDTVSFVKDLAATGFIGPLSVEIDVKAVDSVGAMFDIHTVTHDPSAKTYSRSFTVEYSLPAFLRDIEGKNGARYAFVVTPLAPVEIDSSACLINHRGEKAFSSMPSAFMDLYYVPNSVADFFWESVRGYLDTRYRLFKSYAGLTLPGKLLVYLCPCPIYSVIWDKRFGMAVDPTRNTAFSIYTKERVTADPFIVTFAALLRNYGYTAPFLSEGLANYFSFAAVDMKNLLADNRRLSLQSLLRTPDFYSADPLLADRVSTTFVKYLVNQYSLDRFIHLYRAADDLNIVEKIESTYGKSIGDLEAEWKNYVDTLTPAPSDFYAAATLTEQMLNYPAMLSLARDFMNVGTTASDTIKALKMIRRGSFFMGDYYAAADIQNTLIHDDSSAATEWMARGAYRMMTGAYDEAMTDFRRAYALDSTTNMVAFNLALGHLYRGDTVTAREILADNVVMSKGATAQGEIRITMANILAHSADSTDRQQAEYLYRDAINMYEGTLGVYRSSATNYMWLGIAYLGLGEHSRALDYLSVAEFIETRAFYNGMIQLWLGQTYQAMGEHEQARDHLASVLTTPSSDYHQRQARALLEQLQ